MGKSRVRKNRKVGHPRYFGNSRNLVASCAGLIGGA
jgi:hypothetical protein